MKIKKFLFTVVPLTFGIIHAYASSSLYFQCDVDVSSINVQASGSLCGVTFETLPAVAGGPEAWIDQVAFSIDGNTQPSQQDCLNTVKSDGFLTPTNMGYDGVSVMCTYKGSAVEGNRPLLSYLNVEAEGAQPFGGQLEQNSGGNWVKDSALQCFMTNDTKCQVQMQQ